MTKPLYFYNGTTFELVGPTTPQSPIAYQTSAPTAPATGDIWIDSDGDVDTYNRQLTRYYFVATAGQTSVTGVDANGLTLAYVAGSEAVYVNGALQVRGVDYTATNGTSITGLSALGLNDVVEVFAYTAFTVANAYTKSETDGVAAAAAGLRMVVPTSISVGSGSGSVDALGNITFSNASTVSINGCFTSTYDNYQIIVTNLTNSAAANMQFRLRASGTDASGANTYKYQGFYSDGGTLGNESYNTTQFGLGIASTTVSSMIDFSFYEPFLAKPTKLKSMAWDVHNEQNLTYTGFHNQSTSYDGFTLLTTTGNATGTIRVYGYKD